jgi:hypothetical protein
LLDFGRHLKLIEIKLTQTLRREFFMTMLRAVGTFPTVKSYLISLSQENLVQDKISARNWAAIGTILSEKDGS